MTKDFKISLRYSYLKIIDALALFSSIKVGDKVNTTDMTLSHNTNIDSLNRLYKGESRYKTITFIFSVISSIKLLFESLEYNESQYTEIKGLIIGAIRGLENLAITYSGDEYIIENINSAIHELKLLSKT